MTADINRRDWLKVAGAAGASLVIPSTLAAQQIANTAPNALVSQLPVQVLLRSSAPSALISQFPVQVLIKTPGTAVPTAEDQVDSAA